MNHLLIKVKFVVYFLILRLIDHIALSCILYDGKLILMFLSSIKTILIALFISNSQKLQPVYNY